MKQSRLSLLARNRIEVLQKQGFDLDLDDIINLHYAGLKLEAPDGLPDLSVLGNPIQCGNVILWPLSIGASIWYNRRAAVWFASSPELNIYALAYAYAHAYKPEILHGLINQGDASKAVSEWAKTVTATKDELLNALDQLMPELTIDRKTKICPECQQVVHPEKTADDVCPDSDFDETSFVDVIASLMLAYPGKDYAYWAWQTSQSLALRLLDRANRRELAKNGQIDPHNPQMVATHNFEQTAHRIKAKHEARRNRQIPCDDGAGAVKPLLEVI